MIIYRVLLICYTQTYTEIYVHVHCMCIDIVVRIFISLVYWPESANTIKLLLLQQLVLKEQIHIQCSHGGSNGITQIHFRETINILRWEYTSICFSFLILFSVWLFFFIFFVYNSQIANSTSHVLSMQDYRMYILTANETHID